METRIYVREVVGFTPYWSCGESLSEARKMFKKYSGRYPTSKADIIALTGKREDVIKTVIDDMGTITYEKTIVKVVLQ